MTVVAPHRPRRPLGEICCAETDMHICVPRPRAHPGSHPRTALPVRRHRPCQLLGEQESRQTTPPGRHSLVLLAGVPLTRRPVAGLRHGDRGRSRRRVRSSFPDHRHAVDDRGIPSCCIPELVLDESARTAATRVSTPPATTAWCCSPARCRPPHRRWSERGLAGRQRARIVINGAGCVRANAPGARSRNVGCADHGKRQGRLLPGGAKDLILPIRSRWSSPTRIDLVSWAW